MLIRRANVEEMKALWKYSNSPTYNYFVNGLTEGQIEFWTIEDKETRKLIAELYIFWDSEDKDEADGINRAYLCALRVEKAYRGQGLSTKLMSNVLQRVKERGYTEVVIGVDNREYDKLKGMYNSWGFNEHLKKTHIDYHYRDNNNAPTYYEAPFDLFLCKL